MKEKTKIEQLKEVNLTTKDFINYFHFIKYYPKKSVRWSITNMRVNLSYNKDKKFIHEFNKLIKEKKMNDKERNDKIKEAKSYLYNAFLNIQSILVDDYFFNQIYVKEKKENLEFLLTEIPKIHDKL